MQRSIRVFTCDRCHDRVEVELEGNAPKGWQRITTAPMNGDEQALAPCWELCGSCFKEHLLRALQPVTRVADVADNVRAEHADRLRAAEPVPSKVAPATA